MVSATLISAQRPWQWLALILGLIPVEVIRSSSHNSSTPTKPTLPSIVLATLYSLGSVTCLVFAVYINNSSFSNYFVPSGISDLVWFSQLGFFGIGVLVIYVHAVRAWPHLKAVLDQLYTIDQHLLEVFGVIDKYNEAWNYCVWSTIGVIVFTSLSTLIAMFLRMILEYNEEEINLWVTFFVTHAHFLIASMVLTFRCVTRQIKNRIRLLNQVTVNGWISLFCLLQNEWHMRGT